MEAEIIFSGLCSFINVRDANNTMTEPSVIVVRTTPRLPQDDPPPPAPEGEPEPKEHIPYIAFRTANVKVDVLEGGFEFEKVPKAPGFQLLRLDGVELKIEGNPPANPTVHDSYDRVVKKDDYWPEAKDLWDRDFVPEPAQDGGPLNRPKKSAVVGFMRFGAGRIAAGRIAPVEWSFARQGAPPHRGRFAEEVIYSGFPHGDGTDVVIRLEDLETGESRGRLRFSPRTPKDDKVTLFVGNNDEEDIDNAVQRRIPSDVPDNDHFKYLNRVAKLNDDGPIPLVVRPSVYSPAGPRSGGGSSSGPCGPHSSNG
jgi:hypothetical protein